MKKTMLFLIFAILFIGDAVAQFEITSDEQGKSMLKEGENVYEIPEGVGAVINQEGTLILKNTMENDNVFSFKGVSMQLSKDSEVEYSNVGDQVSLDLNGRGNLFIGETNLNNIQDANIVLDKNGEISFAEFTSAEKENYVFNYGGQEYSFNAEKGGRVFFSPEAKVIRGENTRLNFNSKIIESDNFNLFLDEQGDINKLEISKGGNYRDIVNDLKYSSDEDFFVYFDGRDISQEKNAILILDDKGTIQARGKLKIENDIIYKGLVESAFFTRALEGAEEIIFISAEEDKNFEEGGIATLTKKIKIGDLTAESGFSKDREIKTVIYSENGKEGIRLNTDSINFLAQIRDDPTKFALINKNLMLGLNGGESFFGINEDFGIVLDNLEGQVQILSPTSTNQYLGNDLKTVKGIVSEQVKDNLGGIELQSLGIQKIYDLQRESLITTDKNGNKKQFQASIESFDKTKDFIKKTYSDELQESAVLSSFITNTLENIPYDSRKSGIIDSQQLATMDNFRIKNLMELKKTIESNAIIQDYLINNKGDLNSFGQNVYSSFSENPLSIQPSKESLEKLFQNRIIYESLAEAYLPREEYKVWDETKGLSTEIADYKRDVSSVINSYKGILYLEDAMRNSEIGIDSENSLKLTILTADETANLPSTFSTKKLNLMEGLAQEYARKGEISNAVAAMNQLEDEYNKYLLELDEKINLKDSSNKKTYSSLLDLNEKIKKDRASITSPGFNKIRMDLYNQELAIREELEEKTSGASEKLSKLPPLEPGKIPVQFFVGGYGKDIVNWAGGFQEIKETAKNLEASRQKISRGTYAIQFLYESEIPKERIKSWLENKISTQDILYDFGFSENYIETQKQTWLISEKPKLYTKGEYEETFGFLEEAKKDAQYSYFSDEYGEDIKKILGLEKLAYGNYGSQEKLGVDVSLQRREFEERIKRNLEFEKDEKILNFIDEALSPGAVAIGAISGGFGGTAIFGSATGLTGAGLGVAENIVIDAAAATLLVSSGVEIEEHPWLATGTAVGAGFFGAGLSKIASGIAKSQARNVDEYASAIAKNFGVEDQLKAQNALKHLSSEEIGNPQIVSKELEDAGIKNFDGALISKEIDRLEVQKAVAGISDEEFDKHLSSLGLRRTKEGKVINKYGDEILNLKGLRSELNYITETKEAASKFREAKARIRNSELEGIVQERQKNLESARKSLELSREADEALKKTRLFAVRDRQLLNELELQYSDAARQLQESYAQKGTEETLLFKKDRIYFMDEHGRTRIGVIQDISSDKARIMNLEGRLLDFDLNDLKKWNSGGEKYYANIKQEGYSPIYLKKGDKLPDNFAMSGIIAPSFWHETPGEILVFNREMDITFKNFLEDSKNKLVGMNQEQKIHEATKLVREALSEKVPSSYNNGVPVAAGKCLVAGQGVCRHKSVFLKKILDEEGISSEIVRGQLYVRGRQPIGKHAWLEVELDDGRVFRVDPEWDEITSNIEELSYMGGEGVRRVRLDDPIIYVEKPPSPEMYDHVPDLEKVGEEEYFNYFLNKMVNRETRELQESFVQPLNNMKKELEKMSPESKVDGRLKGLDKIEEKVFGDIKKGDLNSREEVFAVLNEPSAKHKIRDIAGTRVQADSLEEIEVIAESINKRIESGEWKQLKYEDYINNPKDGYRGVHFIVEVDGMPVEIQIKTREQIIWSDWAHDRIYKGQYKNNPIAKQYAIDTGNWVYDYNRGIKRQLPICPETLIKVNLCFECC